MITRDQLRAAHLTAARIDGVLGFATAAQLWGMADQPDRIEVIQRHRTRQNELIGLGWTVLRLTWPDLVDRPGHVIATIRRHLTNSGSPTG